MRPVLPLSVDAGQKPQKGFLHERRRLQGRVLSLTRQVTPSQTIQLCADQRPQTIER